MPITLKDELEGQNHEIQYYDQKAADQNQTLAFNQIYDPSKSLEENLEQNERQEEMFPCQIQEIQEDVNGN